MHPLHLLSALAMLSLAVVSPQVQAADTVRVITDRTETHLAPLFRYYQETTGDTVQAVYVGKGLLARLQAQPTEADLLISSTAEIVEAARTKGLLQAWNSPALAALPARFRDADRAYIITSYRARGLFVSKERVPVGQPQRYEDLITPAWKGRVLIRAGTHPYNLSLFCQMAEAWGLPRTEAYITGLKANLARTPKANDRGQVEAIFQGVGDVSFGNSYYMGMMLARDDQRPWGQAVRYVFPDQDGEGTFVMRAAAGLTTATANTAAATRLLEFLAGDVAQIYLANTLGEYPINDKLPLSDSARSLGQEQPGISDGRFKICEVAVRDSTKHLAAITAILTKVNFNQ